SGLKPGHRLRYVFTKSDRLPSDSIPFTDTPFLASSPAGPRCVFVTGDIENLVSDQSDPAILNLADAETRAWILAETPILRMESRQPEGLGFVPKVWFGSNEQTWEGIGQAYLKRIRQPLEQVPAADKLAQSIVRSEDSDEQKARAVLRWIQDKMAYQALEFGVHAQVPNAVDLTLRNRFGDCKDLSLLGLQMLRALKIRSHMCLVNTAGAIEKSAPDMAQFDHAILFLPDIGGGAFVDCTSRFVDPLRTGPAAWFGKDVLILDDNEIRFQRIQADTANHSRIDSKRTVTLSADSNDVLVTESLTVDGGYATSLRSFLLGTNEANIKSYLAETLTDRNRVELVSYQSVNAEDFLKPLVLKLTYRIRKVVRVRGELRRVKLPGRWEEYLLRESVVSERLTPFELKVPLRFTSSVELKVPAGWKCETDPQTEADRNDWLDYRIERTEQGSSLKLESRIARKSGRYPASSFSPYQDSVNLAVDAVTPELVFSTSNP
ncbi:MAG: transglutaminase family protein, partial [Planctomycetaceae bacterium]